MSYRSTDTDSASAFSASSAASYQRKKQSKDQTNDQYLHRPMSASDYSDYSRYPRFTQKTAEKEGPGIRMRSSNTYDDNALPAGYQPVTNTTGRADEPHHSRNHHQHHRRRSSSNDSPRVRHEVKTVPHPAIPGGVVPQLVTHVHLSSPHRSRRHRSASRERPPVASRPAYGRRRSRSYDDGHRPRTHIINLPPPPVASIPSGSMYGTPQQQQQQQPLRSLPASPEYGYGRPMALPTGYGGTQPFVPPRSTDFSAGQRSAPGMGASTSGSSYPSSRRRAQSHAHTHSSASPSSRSDPRHGMGTQYSPYGGTPVMAQHGATTAPYVINLPPPGVAVAQQPMTTGSRRARATSLSGLGYGANAMGAASYPYGSPVTAPGAGVGNLFGGGVGDYAVPPSVSGHHGRGHGHGGHTGGVYSEDNPYGAGNIGYGQSANGVYGYAPGQARDPKPWGTAPSPPFSQRPPGTGFFGGLFGRKHGSGNGDHHDQDQNHGRHKWRLGHHN